MQLNDTNLARIADSVGQPGYDRSGILTGIVHFGPGAFHRAHQADYADRAMATVDGLGICAVSLRSFGVRDALRSQDNLYTLAIVDREPAFRVIGSIREFLVAPEDPQAVVRRMCDPAIHTITLTLTEKGYCLDALGHLDVNQRDIVADLARPRQPRTAIGFIVEALRMRRKLGVPPFAVVSCDNLPDNGTRLGRAVAEFAVRVDAGLAGWIRENVAFPRTMVDSITPATDDALRHSVMKATGLTDAWPVQRERFSQWVIEDKPLPCKDAWERVGVIFSKDVNGFEVAKLRMLNGQHSALAYLGILAGLSTVLDAAGDPQLRKFLAQLVETEIRPSIPPSPGMDLSAYSASLVERFGNPMIEHRLEQIAIDGSQKIPIRIFAPLRENLAAGRPIHCLCLVIAAWLNFLETHNADTLDDPMAAELLAVRDILQENTSRGIRAFFDLQLVRKGGLPDDPQLMSELGFACDSLRGVRGTAVGDSINRYLAQCETKP